MDASRMSRNWAVSQGSNPREERGATPIYIFQNVPIYESFESMHQAIPREEMEAMIDVFVDGGDILNFKMGPTDTIAAAQVGQDARTDDVSQPAQGKHRRGRPQKPPGAPKARYNNTNRAASAKANRDRC